MTDCIELILSCLNVHVQLGYVSLKLNDGDGGTWIWLAGDCWYMLGVKGDTIAVLALESSRCQIAWVQKTPG